MANTIAAIDQLKQHINALETAAITICVGMQQNVVDHDGVYDLLHSLIAQLHRDVAKLATPST